MSISNFLDIDSWGDHGFDKNFDFEEAEMISVQQEDILRSITMQQFRVIPVSMSILKGVLFDDEFLVTLTYMNGGLNSAPFLMLPQSFLEENNMERKVTYMSNHLIINDAVVSDDCLAAGFCALSMLMSEGKCITEDLFLEYARGYGTLVDWRRYVPSFCRPSCISSNGAYCLFSVLESFIWAKKRDGVVVRVIGITSGKLKGSESLMIADVFNEIFKNSTLIFSGIQESNSNYKIGSNTVLFECKELDVVGECEVVVDFDGGTSKMVLPKVHYRPSYFESEMTTAFLKGGRGLDKTHSHPSTPTGAFMTCYCRECYEVGSILNDLVLSRVLIDRVKSFYYGVSYHHSGQFSKDYFFEMMALHIVRRNGRVKREDLFNVFPHKVTPLNALIGQIPGSRPDFRVEIRDEYILFKGSRMIQNGIIDLTKNGGGCGGDIKPISSFPVTMIIDESVNSKSLDRLSAVMEIPMIIDVKDAKKCFEFQDLKDEYFQNGKVLQAKRDRVVVERARSKYEIQKVILILVCPTGEIVGFYKKRAEKCELIRANKSSVETTYEVVQRLGREYLNIKINTSDAVTEIVPGKTDLREEIVFFVRLGTTKNFRVKKTYFKYSFVDQKNFANFIGDDEKILRSCPFRY